MRDGYRIHVMAVRYGGSDREGQGMEVRRVPAPRAGTVANVNPRCKLASPGTGIRILEFTDELEGNLDG